MAEIPEPKTRLEQYWAGILDKIEGGGGNPNYVETIEGTLANPWGEYSIKDIINLLLDNSITVSINATIRFGEETGQYSGMISLVAISASFIRFAGAIQLKQNSVFAVAIRYNKNSGTINSNQSGWAVMDTPNSIYQNGELDPTTPCTLTIIHHPLPDSGT